MKNIFKKIGVLSLVLAVLSPFIELPVMAADDQCEHYLQTYLFLDSNSGVYFKNYSRSNGYRTYTSFPYAFPKVDDNEYIRIDSVGQVPLDGNTKLQTYYGTLTSLTATPDRYSSSADLGKIGYASELKFIAGEYDTETSILHGQWAREDDEEPSDAGWVGDDKDPDNDETEFVNSTIQHVILEKKEKDKSSTINVGDMKFTVGGAAYISNKYVSASSYSDKPIDFFQAVVDGVQQGENSQVYKNGYVTVNGNKTFINLGVQRNIARDDLNELVYGFKDKDSGTWYAFSSKSGSTVDDIEDSYTALENYRKWVDAKNDDDTVPDCINGDVKDSKGNTIEACYRIAVNEDNIDFDTNSTYLWPETYNVEYSICKTNNKTPSPEVQWKLSYNKNSDKDDVINMPNTQSAKVGVPLKVSDLKPSRKDYVFQGWCTKDKSSCPKSGDEIKDNGASEIVLYAQWGPAGSTDNPEQGVVSYAIGFIIVGLIAGGIYTIGKRKNLFKQI